MAIVPGDLVRVVADRRHRRWRQRRPRSEVLGAEDPEGVRRLLVFFPAAGAGAVVTQMLPGIDAAVAIVPLDDQALGTFFAQSRGHQWIRAGSGHNQTLLTTNRPRRALPCKHGAIL